MSQVKPEQAPPAAIPDPDALLVALVLAPATYSRNKYFTLFQNREAHRIRRRAQLVRSILKELTEPWPSPSPHELRDRRPAPEATIVDEYPTPDGVQLIYRVEEFDYTRSATLTHLEAAALRYALSRAGRRELDAEDRRRVENALARLDPTV